MSGAGIVDSEGFPRGLVMDSVVEFCTPGEVAAGPVGAVCPPTPSTVLFRSLLTSRTDWNFES